MNIVHFSAGRINPYAAKVGSVNVIYWLAREQARIGHNVKTVIIPAKFDYENIKTNEFQIVEYPQASWLGFVLPKALVQDIRTGQLQIDVAHLHGVYVPQMIAVAALLRKHGIPYVISTHGSLSPYVLKKGSVLAKWVFKTLFVHRYLNNAAFLHLHCEGEVKDAHWYKVKVPIVVAEHGFDWEIFPKERLNENWLAEHFPQHFNKFKLVFLGRLDPWTKGIDLLLHGFALALKRYNDMVLFLIGPEKRRYKEVIPKLINQLGLQQSVVLVGPLYNPIEKFSALSSGDIFVLTSRYDVFPLVLYEAMACKKAVIVTPGTNAAKFVQHHGIGWVCESTPEAIAQAIITAYESREKLDSMGAKAQKLLKDFTWKRTAKILCEHYQRVV